MALDQKVYKNMLDNLSDGVYFLDTDRTIIYWNKGAEEITGYSADEVIGLKCSDNILIHIDQEGNRLCDTGCPAAQTLVDGKRRIAEIYLRHKQGYRLPIRVCIDPIVDAQGAIIGAGEFFADISSGICLRQQVSELEQTALLDYTTEIGNRRYAHMNVHERLNEKKRYGWDFGLLFVDIDDFKSTNDTHGHVIGDRVLKMVSKTLASNIRSFDTACRWGGDEFVITLIHIDPKVMQSTAEKLRWLVQKSSLYENKKPICVTISIGATIARDDDTADTLTQRADALMYRSKQDGRNRVTAD